MALSKLNLPANIQISSTDNVDCGMFIARITFKPTYDSVIYEIVSVQDANRKTIGKIKVSEQEQLNIDGVPYLNEIKNPAVKQVIENEFKAVCQGVIALANFIKPLQA
jgi:hypothetical protein